MDRRTSMVGVATVAAVLLLVLAASSGPTRLWVTPAANDSPAADIATPTTTVTTTAADGRSSGPGHAPDWLGAVLQTAAIGLIVLVVVMYLVADKLGVRVPLWRWQRRRRRRAEAFDALPAVQQQRLVVDETATRAALLGGTPRNAIVACWMQLERDAASAGLPRAAADTPTEYVRRVIASASLDPAPIDDLVALYREARFSRHSLTDDDRQQAVEALGRVLAGLDVHDGVSR